MSKVVFLGGDGDDRFEVRNPESFTPAVDARGGLGNDTLDGGAAADALDGEAGVDSATGGSGADAVTVAGVPGARAFGFAPGTDALTVAGQSFVGPVFADRPGRVWGLRADGRVSVDGAVPASADYSNIRQLAVGTNGRIWVLSRDGRLRGSGNDGATFPIRIDGVMSPQTTDPTRVNGDPPVNRAYPAGALRHFRHDASLDVFWTSSATGFTTTGCRR